MILIRWIMFDMAQSVINHALCFTWLVLKSWHTIVNRRLVQNSDFWLYIFCQIHSMLIDELAFLRYCSLHRVLSFLSSRFPSRIWLLYCLNFNMNYHFKQAKAVKTIEGVCSGHNLLCLHVPCSGTCKSLCCSFLNIYSIWTLSQEMMKTW